MLMAVITPPMQVADEPAHFFRAYHISLGHLLSEREGDCIGGRLPRDLLIFYKIGQIFPISIMREDKVREKSVIDLRVIKALLCQPAGARSRPVLIPYNSSAFYPPVSYIPQALGIALARWLGLAPLISMYAGRLLNSFFYIFLAGAAIRTMRAQRWMMALIALLPMSLFQAASLSPDGLTNGLSFLFIAQNLALMADKQGSMRQRNSMRLVLLLSFLLALSKACPTIILLPFVIASDRIRTRGHYWFWTAGVIGCFALTTFAWGFLNRHLYFNSDPTKGVSAQWLAMCHNPGNFLRSVWGGVSKDSFYYLETFVGRLGWLSVKLPKWVVTGTFAWLILLSIVDFSTSRDTPSRRTRLISCAIVASGILLIFTWLYLSWCPIGFAYPISGVQGRYFITLAPVLGIALLRARRPSWEHAVKIGLAAWIVIIEAAAVLSLWHAYY
jgi:uncharacterized membrane protein